MAAVLLRLCDEDRETYDITQEWLRFDDADLDDVDSTTLSEYEVGMGAYFHILDSFDRPRNTIRWQACQVWLACRLAGFKIPDLFEFRIKIRKVERKDEPTAAGDVDPPDPASSATSAARARSKKR